MSKNEFNYREVLCIKRLAMHKIVFEVGTTYAIEDDVDGRPDMVYLGLVNKKSSLDKFGYLCVHDGIYVKTSTVKKHFRTKDELFNEKLDKLLE